MFAWINKDGTIRGAVFNNEYELLVDFENGYLFDLSPNLLVDRRGVENEFHDGKWMEYAELVEAYGLNEESGHEYISIEYQEMTFEDFSTYVRERYDARMGERKAGE